MKDTSVEKTNLVQKIKQLVLQGDMCLNMRDNLQFTFIILEFS